MHGNLISSRALSTNSCMFDFLNLKRCKRKADGKAGKSSLRANMCGFKDELRGLLEQRGNWRIPRQTTTPNVCGGDEADFSYLVFDCIIFQYSNVIVMCLIIMFLGGIGVYTWFLILSMPAKSLKYVIIISFVTCTHIREECGVEVLEHFEGRKIAIS